MERYELGQETKTLRDNAVRQNDVKCSKNMVGFVPKQKIAKSLQVFVLC